MIESPDELDDAERERLTDRTEDWFVRIGIPHFIDDFRASEDVWTRAIGFLSLVFFGELFLTFGQDSDGLAQFGVFLVGLIIVVGAIAAVNRYRGRRSFQRPDDIGLPELALFVLIPPVLALLGGHRQGVEFFGIIGLNLAVLVLAYIVVSWGLFAMLRWGLASMWSHLSQVVQLLGRILPLMLLFSAFLFLNAEIWQVVNDFDPTLYAIVLTGLGVIALGFLVGAMQGAISELRWFDTWDEVERELSDTPLEGIGTRAFPDRPKRIPLSRAARVNLTLRLVVGLGAQVILVTAIIFGFYVAFGLLTVREDTVLQWTTLETDVLSDVELARWDLFGAEVLLTRLHLVAAGLVAAFSGLQFAVSLVTDDAYREDFLRDSNAEVREAIAVRAVYLRLTRGVET